MPSFPSDSTAPTDPSSPSAAAAARWVQAQGAWTLQLEGDWRGRPPALPALPQPDLTAALAVDAQGLKGWDAHLAAALWHSFASLGTARARLDLSSLPSGLRQILEMALPPAAAEAAPAPRRGSVRARWVRAIGRRASASWASTRETLSFFGETTQALVGLLRGRSDMRSSDLAWHLEQTGPRSLPILLLVCFLVGLIVAYMGGAQLQRFGAETYVADLVTIGVVREIAALLVGIVLAGRVGAAFAAQLGSMQANDEIDALRTMGVDPVGHLVLPRVLALLISGPLLTAFGALVGMFVGWLVAVVIFGVSPLEYLFKSSEALTIPHVLIGLLKGTVYAVLVALAGCRQGLAAGRSAQAVGDATTAAVVQGIVWVVIAASVLTVVFQRLDW